VLNFILAMQIAHKSHIRNPNPNTEGGREDSEFDLTLFRLKSKNTYELKITSKIVLDFMHYKHLLPPNTQSMKYQENWSSEFQEIVKSKWGKFRLVDRRNNMFFVRVTLDCVMQTPNTKTSDYHIWVWIHPKFSFAQASQPNFYRGYAWNLRPEDIKGNGNGAHEFGHMIGVTHFNDRNGDRLMYGNDKDKFSERGVEMIKNANGYVYPEVDLNFHRHWVQEKLQEKRLVKEGGSLWYEPSRNK